MHASRSLPASPGESAPADPDKADFWFHLGNQRYSRKDYSGAADCFRRALQLAPGLVEAHYNLGNTYLEMHAAEAATACYHQALALSPGCPEAFFNLGIAYCQQARLEAAIDCYQRAVAAAPEMAPALFNLGLAFQETGRLDEAIDCYRRLLRLQPDSVEGLNNLGDAWEQQGRLEDAAGCYLQALSVKPDYAHACYNLGRVRHLQNRMEEAIGCYLHALAIQPDYHKACNNLAKAFQDQGQIERAIYWYREALRIKADYAEARFNLATARLLKGDYPDGWQDYEWRFRRSDWKHTYPHRFDKPRWKGESLAGKTLLVHCEQGFGDILQFVRYLPMLKAQDGTVMLESRKATLRLFQTLPGVDRLIPYSPESPPAVEFDWYTPLLSLPGVFNTSLATIPSRVPYLHAEPDKIRQWQGRFSGRELRVGLAWAGTATDPRRALPLAWFAPLSTIPGLKIFSLQKGPAADLLASEGPPPGMHIENIGREFEDFSDTAAAIEHLDLVVSIDTSVAHLAGAMGKPVYLLLSSVPDWRWMLDREDSPWYPTMRLFRQKTAGDWGPPLTMIGRRLDSLARNLLRAADLPGASGILAAAVHHHKPQTLIEALVFYRRLLREQPDHPQAVQCWQTIASQMGIHAVR